MTTMTANRRRHHNDDVTTTFVRSFVVVFAAAAVRGDVTVSKYIRFQCVHDIIPHQNIQLALLQCAWIVLVLIVRLWCSSPITIQNSAIL